MIARLNVIKRYHQKLTKPKKLLLTTPEKGRVGYLAEHANIVSLSLSHFGTEFTCTAIFRTTRKGKNLATVILGVIQMSISHEVAKPANQQTHKNGNQLKVIIKVYYSKFCLCGVRVCP